MAADRQEKEKSAGGSLSLAANAKYLPSSVTVTQPYFITDTEGDGTIFFGRFIFLPRSLFDVSGGGGGCH